MWHFHSCILAIHFAAQLITEIEVAIHCPFLHTCHNTTVINAANGVWVILILNFAFHLIVINRRYLTYKSARHRCVTYRIAVKVLCKQLTKRALQHLTQVGQTWSAIKRLPINTPIKTTHVNFTWKHEPVKCTFVIGKAIGQRRTKRVKETNTSVFDLQAKMQTWYLHLQRWCVFIFTFTKTVIFVCRKAHIVLEVYIETIEQSWEATSAQTVTHTWAQSWGALPKHTIHHRHTHGQSGVRGWVKSSLQSWGLTWVEVTNCQRYQSERNTCGTWWQCDILQITPF